MIQKFLYNSKLESFYIDNKSNGYLGEHTKNLSFSVFPN